MIRLCGISKVYISGRTCTQVLDDISLAVARGQCLLVDGPSGSGKTTLLNIMGCICRPSSGSVEIDGEAVSDWPEHFLARFRRERIGLIFQQFNLLPGFNVLQNIVMPMVPLGLSEREMTGRAAPLIERLSLGHRLTHRIGDLSGGEQQRVAFARALVNEPDIILADEPSSNVDEDNARAMLDLLTELKSRGRTVVICSHDPVVKLSGLADMVLVLPGGRKPDAEGALGRTAWSPGASVLPAIRWCQVADKRRR